MAHSVIALTLSPRLTTAECADCGTALQWHTNIKLYLSPVSPACPGNRAGHRVLAGLEAARRAGEVTW